MDVQLLLRRWGLLIELCCEWRFESYWPVA